jgi:catechol 2,3-dioxygenase-like lactoylglutathione lyase family enzyme
MFKDVKTVAIYVTDLEAAKAFYTDVLGFRCAAQVALDLCFLVSESGSVHVYLKGSMKPGRADRRSTRLSFFLEPEGSVSDTYGRLKSSGVRLLQKAPEYVGDGNYWFQFEDPDGNIIEVAGT